MIIENDTTKKFYVFLGKIMNNDNTKFSHFDKNNITTLIEIQKDTPITFSNKTKTNGNNGTAITEIDEKKNIVEKDEIKDLYLLNQELESIPDYVEVVFKCKRKAIYRNDYGIVITKPDYVLLEVENGIDFGFINSFGEEALSKLKSIYKNEKVEHSVIRLANADDLEKFNRNRLEEVFVVEKTKEYVKHNAFDMKVIEAEWQYDRQRLTIFFTAPQRIDFRELVKELARNFKTRIELRQISTREEAKRIEGIGSCGRTICCSCFANDFNHVTLDHAKTQQLSNNIAKLSGYCGRLKCCLLYEYDTYIEAFKKFPPINSIVNLDTLGEAVLCKIDIFKNIVYLNITASGAYKQLTFIELEQYRKNGKIQYAKEEHHCCDHLKSIDMIEDLDLINNKF